MSKEKTPFEQAIHKAGGQVALAEAIGTSQQLVSYWLKKKVPAEWVVKIEEQTGITRHQLRPDIFGAA